MRRRVLAAAAAGALLASAPALGLVADDGHTGPSAEPAQPPVELPVLHRATGLGTERTQSDAAPAPSAKVIDGAIGDWVGQSTGYGGTVVHSAGELVYTDHLFDAYGADDGRDAERLGRLEPLNDAVPETYRVEPIYTADAPGELGADVPGFEVSDRYGDADRVDVADLLEVRLAADAETLYVLARTTTMHAAGDTAVLLLLDTTPGSATRPLGFGSGLTSDVADIAVLLASGRGRAVDLVTGASAPVTVAADPTDYVNAIEAAVPVGLLAPGWTGGLRVAAAAGAFQPAADPADDGFVDIPALAANVANVAFRTAEPVSAWFERDQALALLGTSIDDFFIAVDPAALAAGADESWAPGPGYHDRIFLSSPTISSEGGTEGIHQHYGVYLPSRYDPDVPAPMTIWLHWRGGKAHSAATISPRIFRDQGEAFGGIVVAPRGRGTSTWYVGKGHVDVNEVWADAFANFAIDPDRVYVSGHSMGGWGSYLLSILYPDRFAAAFPVAGPVTQGAWTGVDFAGCDELAYSEYTPCYVGANGSDPRAQHTRRLLENLRNVPLAIFQGGADELVPTGGVTRQVERLVELGYRHRYYLFPAYEHYSHPITDEWIAGARYVHQFVRNPNPPRVSYVRDMVFERTVETGPSQENKTTGLSFDFDRAYWMSELTPVDATSGVARFEGLSRALPAEPSLRVPEAGGPAELGQVGPFVMSGIAWLADPLAVAQPTNAFDITLEGARQVRLDVARMGLSVDGLHGVVTSEHDLLLRLDGNWGEAPVVSIDGRVVPATVSDGVLELTVPAGTAQLVTVD